jgi:hypothetical protein
LRIRADEHIAPKITKAVQSLVLTEGWELTHVRDFHAARTADETWIPRFAAEGGNAILSADRKMLGRPHQLAAIAEGNLIGVFLSSQWAGSRRHVQAASIIWWWPKIEKAISAASPRQCFKVPFDFSGDSLQEIHIDFEGAAAGRK